MSSSMVSAKGPGLSWGGGSNQNLAVCDGGEVKKAPASLGRAFRAHGERVTDQDTCAGEREGDVGPTFAEVVRKCEARTSRTGGQGFKMPGVPEWRKG